jgi:hypothetical protein
LHVKTGGFSTPPGKVHFYQATREAYVKRVFAGLVILIAVFCAGQAPGQEVKGPKISVREMNHDFGKTVQGTRVSHVFEVRNAGAETLVIERVQTS